MRQYSYGYLQDYFSARGLTLTRNGLARSGGGYTLTNGARTETLRTMREVNKRARLG